MFENCMNLRIKSRQCQQDKTKKFPPFRKLTGIYISPDYKPSFLYFEIGEQKNNTEKSERKKEGERALPFEFKWSLEKGLGAISENRSGWNTAHLGVFFPKRTKARHFLPILISAAGYKVAWSTTFSILLCTDYRLRSFSSPLSFRRLLFPWTARERKRQKASTLCSILFWKRPQITTWCSKVLHFHVARQEDVMRLWRSSR